MRRRTCRPHDKIRTMFGAIGKDDPIRCDLSYVCIFDQGNIGRGQRFARDTPPFGRLSRQRVAAVKNGDLGRIVPQPMLHRQRQFNTGDPAADHRNFAIFWLFANNRPAVGKGL